jgi:NitT/TauT family transport system permease protein
MPSKMGRITRTYLLPGLTLVGVLLVWEALYLIFQIPQFVIPAPSGIFAETWEWKYRLIGHTWVTLYETIGGFALSVGIGTPLAVMLVYNPTLRNALYPLLVIAQSVPKVAIAPILLLILGAGEVSKIVVAF